VAAATPLWIAPLLKGFNVNGAKQPKAPSPLRSAGAIQIWRCGNAS